MPDPLISIIIPVYNGGNFLQRCFATLDAQKYHNLEFIFVNNNSTDHSEKMIEQYCKSRQNAQLLQCEQQGPGAARNKGIDFSRGEYISFLDADDELEPDKHTILLDGFKQYPHAVMSVGQTRKVYPDGRNLITSLGSLKVGLNEPPKPSLSWLRQFQFNPATCSYLIKKNIFKKNKITFASIPYGEDIAFNVLVGLSNEVIYMDTLVCTYHRHSKSSVSMANQQISSLERYFQFYEKFALPLFYKKKREEPFKQAFNVSERIAFRMLMKLIHVEKKKIYKNVYQRLVIKSYLKNRSFFYTFFHFCPFRISNYIFEKFSFK